MNDASGAPHSISLETAIKMTTLYRAQRNRILGLEWQGKDLLSISDTFDRTALDRLLAQPGCTAVRIYYGMEETLQVHAVVVGVNANDQDILPMPETPDAEILDVSKLCPPFCAPESPLNT
jgi:hypothetical protein